MRKHEKICSVATTAQTLEVASLLFWHGQNNEMFFQHLFLNANANLIHNTAAGLYVISG